MKEVVMKVDDEFWDHITQLTVFKEQKKIVHCKDCKYFKFGNGCFLQSVDYDWEEQMGADDFCSRGERK